MADNQEKPIYHSLPRHLVDFLGEKKYIESHISEYQKTPIISEISEIVDKTLTEIIVPYYNSKGVNLSMDNLAKFIRGPLENANTHSGSDQPIRIGIYLSRGGMIASFNDGGEYFKNQNVKRSYEKREIYRERNEIREIGSGYNSGTKFIFDHADIIYVDSSEGTLYVGLRYVDIDRGRFISKRKYPRESDTIKDFMNEQTPKSQRHSKIQRNSKSQKVRP